MPMAGKWRGFCPACGQSVCLRKGEQWLLPAGCLLNVTHVTCQWQWDIAELWPWAPGCAVLPAAASQCRNKRLCAVLDGDAYPIPREDFGVMLVSQAIFAGYILALSDTIHSGSTHECMSDKTSTCFTNTPWCLSLILDFGPAKINSCIWGVLWGVSPRDGVLQSLHPACSVSECLRDITQHWEWDNVEAKCYLHIKTVEIVCSSRSQSVACASGNSVLGETWRAMFYSISVVSREIS